MKREYYLITIKAGADTEYIQGIRKEELSSMLEELKAENKAVASVNRYYL